MVALEDRKLRARHVGARVRARRKAAGLTQEKMAERLGMRRQHYNALENGYNEPGVDKLERIAHELGCHWTDFYTDSAP